MAGACFPKLHSSGCACGFIQSSGGALLKEAAYAYGGLEHAPDLVARFVRKIGLQDIARHEAGHAVVARRFGWPITSITASWSEGLARFGRRDFRGTIEEGERELLVVGLAGPAAERAHLGDRLRLTDAELRHRLMLARSGRPGTCDVCEAVRVLRVARSLDDADYISVIRAYEHHANELVRRPEVATEIARVAGALVERGSLNSSQVDALLGAGAAPRSATLTRFAEPQYQIRGAQVRSETFDQKAHTISIVWSTGARIRRNTWLDGPVDEELEMGANNVRLGRLNSSAPLLNSHAAGTLASIIGAVVPGSAKIERGRGVAIVRLSRREDVAGIVQDVRDGVIRNVSCGYKVHAVETREGQKGEVPLVRVTDWEPVEISLVPIAADPDARIRSEERMPAPRSTTHTDIARARMRMRSAMAAAR